MTLGFAVFLCADYLVTTLPFVKALYDLDHQLPNAVTKFTASQAESAVMHLTYPGYFYRFDQLNGDSCIGYSESRLAELPAKIAYFKDNLTRNAPEFFDKLPYQCIAADNLLNITESFYLQGFYVTLAVALSVAAIVAAFSLIFVLFCCSGWCSCSCTAWCMLCKRESTAVKFEVYYQGGSTYAKQI